MALIDRQIAQAKPNGKLQKLGDGNGLQLWVHPSGKKSWHFTFREAGKQRSVTLGAYPAMSLKEARAAANVAREAPSKGASSPSSPTFGAVKAEWLALLERQGKATETLARARRMDRYSAPLDRRPIDEIKAPELLQLLRAQEAAGKLETARRLRATLSRIFTYAAALGLADTNPASLLAGTVAPPRATSRAALTDREGFARLLRAIAAYESRSGVREALLLLAYTAARPGEVRLATWGEFDLDAAVWTIPAARMKMRREHRAPLARQVVEMLAAMAGARQFFESCSAGSPDVGTAASHAGLACGHPVSERSIVSRKYGNAAIDASEPTSFLFPSQRPGRPLSENAFNTALRTMGFAKDEMSAHGFRSAFSTLANESGLWSPDAIERHLAHVEQDATRRAYMRGEFWEERVRLAAWWGQQIEEMMG